MKLAEILKENLSETAERKISARFKLILNMANDGANQPYTLPMQTAFPRAAIKNFSNF
jgi:hypothetical protein